MRDVRSVAVGLDVHKCETRETNTPAPGKALGESRLCRVLPEHRWLRRTALEDARARRPTGILDAGIPYELNGHEQ